MMQTSGDILNFSISLAVLAVAFFLCWFLFYLIVSLRRVYKITAQAKKITDKIENLVNLIKSKVKQSGSYLFLFSKLADKAMDYFGEKMKEKKEKEKEEKTEKNGKKNK